MQSLYVKYRPSKFEDVIGQDVTVKILQKQVELKKYKNSWHCLYKIFKEEGYFGLYKGYGTNALRTLGSSVVLVLYDEFQKVCGLEARGKGK